MTLRFHLHAILGFLALLHFAYRHSLADSNTAYRFCFAVLATGAGSFQRRLQTNLEVIKLA